MAEPIELDLAAIRQRVDAATPGPWQLNEHGCVARVETGYDVESEVDGEVWVSRPLIAECDTSMEDEHNADRDEANAQFIAAARSDVPALLDLIETLQAAAQHPFKGPNDTDASMLREAAERVAGGYQVGGQHTSATIERVLKAVADLLDSCSGKAADHG